MVCQNGGQCTRDHRHPRTVAYTCSCTAVSPTNDLFRSSADGTSWERLPQAHLFRQGFTGQECAED
eukprot:COSAG04_NODE_15398_length_533_cov_0.824885_1_plen_65_part_10